MVLLVWCDERASCVKVSREEGPGCQPGCVFYKSNARLCVSQSTISWVGQQQQECQSSSWRLRCVFRWTAGTGPAVVEKLYGLEPATPNHLCVGEKHRKQDVQVVLETLTIDPVWWLAFVPSFCMLIEWIVDQLSSGENRANTRVLAHGFPDLVPLLLSQQLQIITIKMRSESWSESWSVMLKGTTSGFPFWRPTLNQLPLY